MKYIDIRSLHYKSQKIKLKKKFGVDITSFFSQPYTFLKSRLYIEISKTTNITVKYGLIKKMKKLLKKTLVF